jgi:hypothetical protein
MHASAIMTECNKDLAEQSLLTHLRGQHGMELPSNTSVAPTALPLCWTKLPYEWTDRQMSPTSDSSPERRTSFR